MATGKSSNQTTVVRLWTLVAALIVGFGGLFFLTQPEGSLRIIRLSEYYGLAALAFLYFTLLASPLGLAFPGFPWRQQYFAARRVLGISAAAFGLIHGCLTFFLQLKGFEGLPFLPPQYQSATVLGLVVAVILLELALTANDWAVRLFGRHYWKWLHRLVYVAGFALLVHAGLIGTHFKDLGAPIASICGVAIGFLFILEARRIDAWLARRQIFKTGTNLVFAWTVVVLTVYGWSFFVLGLPSPLSVHATHQTVAGGDVGAGHHGQIGRAADRLIRRVTVDLETEGPARAGQKTIIRGRAFNAANGAIITDFAFEHGSQLHLIVVDKNLTWFEHRHLTPAPNGEFSADLIFPNPGEYRLFSEFHPIGGDNDHYGTSLLVAPGPGEINDRALRNNRSPVQRMAGLELTLVLPGPLTLTGFGTGGQNFLITIRDAASANRTVGLQPYLGAKAHAVLIREDSLDFHHLHAEDATVLVDQALTLNFVPTDAAASPYLSGNYRLFVQADLNGVLRLADFALRIDP